MLRSVLAEQPPVSTVSLPTPSKQKNYSGSSSKDIQVHDRRRIIPTYRIPAAVRAIPRKVGGTGLEPTPSLSIRPLACCPLAPVCVYFGLRPLFSEVSVESWPTEDKRQQETYREFRHCTGTARVSRTANAALRIRQAASLASRARVTKGRK